MATLDKFYTKLEVAGKCIDWLSSKINLKDMTVLEPSAGNGSFIETYPYYSQISGLDIAPERNDIKKQDFFTYEDRVDLILGNPPFGKRSKLAINFFNHAAVLSDYIAFIVPVSFMKWSVQKELTPGWHLVDYFYLDENSFTDRGKDFSVRTVFQLWTKKDGFADLRLKKAPPIKHPDFEIWQYNATPQAMKTVDEDWKYAVYRQGYHTYEKFFTSEDREEIRSRMDGSLTGKKQQFFFIKPLTEEADKIIRSMDFNALAARNTSTPGFGKGDFVGYYIEIKESLGT